VVGLLVGLFDLVVALVGGLVAVLVLGHRHAPRMEQTRMPVPWPTHTRGIINDLHVCARRMFTPFARRAA
jgi:hypothetical protein